MTPDLHPTEQLHDQITTPPVVESFSHSQMDAIKKHYKLIPAQINMCQEHLDDIENKTIIEDKNYITEIMRQLLQTITPSESQNIPNIIKNINKQAIKISITQKDIPWYINILLGRSKTELAIQNIQAPSWSDQISESEKELDKQLAQKNEEIKNIDQNINKWKDQVATLTPEEQQIQNQVATLKTNINKWKDQVATLTPEEQQIKENIITKKEKITWLFHDYNNSQKIINDAYTAIPTIEKNKVNKTITLKALENKQFKGWISTLDVLHDAFWYQSKIEDIVLPDWTKKPDYEAWMENDNINNRILILVNYQARLHDRIQRSTTDPSIKISENERQQSQNFSLFLQDAWVDESQFFEGFDIRDFETNKEQQTDGRGWNRRKWKIFGDLGNIASAKEKWSEKSDKRWLESVTDLSENIWNMKDKTKFDSIFRNSSDGKIRSGFEIEEFIKSFPYPKDTWESDFKIDNPNLPRIIQNILSSNKNRPIIDTSTQDLSKIMRAKQSAILYHIMKHNSTISEDDKKSLAKILYPNQKKSWILGRSKDQIQWSIERNLFWPLIMNTFCSERKEQQINNETKKWYFTYINTFIKNTPWLQDFKIRSKRIEITNDVVKIPLYLEGDKKANAYLTIKDGKVYITNKFYNPSDSNSNNEITQGKVMVGYMDDIQTFRDKITKEIKPDIIKETLAKNKSLDIYEDHIQKIIDNTIRTNTTDNESQYTSAGVSHGLSQIKIQDAVIDTMKLRHNDGNMSIDTNKPIDSKSPFYLALRDYTIKNPEAKISKQNQPDAFDSLALIRTTILRNDAGENEKMKENFIALQNLINNESFNTKIETYLQQQTPDEVSQQKHLVLQTLAHTNRTKSESFPLLLKLFGTNPQPGKEQINTIDNNRFWEFIRQLDGDLNNLSVNTLISPTHPVFATLEKKYSTSADDGLDQALSTIGDSNTIEIIKQ
jgi:hypothetical protein